MPRRVLKEDAVRSTGGGAQCAPPPAPYPPRRFAARPTGEGGLNGRASPDPTHRPVGLQRSDFLKEIA